MVASYNGSQEVVSLVLSKGVDINALLKRQITALGEACSRGFQEVADLQVKAGAELELGELSPLLAARRGGHRQLKKVQSESQVRKSSTRIQVGDRVNLQGEAGALGFSP